MRQFFSTAAFILFGFGLLYSLAELQAIKAASDPGPNLTSEYSKDAEPTGFP